MATSKLKSRLGLLMSAASSSSNWVVALAAFWVNFCVLGVLRSNAIVYNALIEEFGISRKAAAWPSGIFGFFMCLTGAVSGMLCHYTSIRNLAVFGSVLTSVAVSLCYCSTDLLQIVVLYGAFQGIGVGLIVPLTHVILNQSFIKYKALALGIAFAGSSVGSFVFPPLAKEMLDTYALRGTFLLLGGIMLNSIPAAILYRSEKSKTSPSLNVQDKEATCPPKDTHNDSCTKNTHNDIEIVYVRNEKRGETLPNQEINEKLCVGRCWSNVRMAMDVVSSPAFLVLSAVYASYFSSSAIYLMVIVDYAKDRGVPVNQGVYLVSAFSVGDLIGRLGSGWIADMQWLRRNCLVRCYLILMGTGFALLPLCPSTQFLVPSIFLGILNGSIIINYSVLLTEYLGLQKLPLAMGFSTCLIGITAFLRPVVIGYFRDRSKSYDHLFLFLGLLQVGITAIWMVEYVHQFFTRRVSFIH